MILGCCHWSATLPQLWAPAGRGQSSLPGGARLHAQLRGAEQRELLSVSGGGRAGDQALQLEAAQRQVGVRASAVSPEEQAGRGGGQLRERALVRTAEEDSYDS